MPHWLIKSGIQRVISWLPASAWGNELFQQHVTRTIHISAKFVEGRMEQASHFLELFRRHRTGGPDEPFTVLEVGTGWYPTLPLAFYLCGASQIHTFDIVNHLNRDRLVL